MRDNIGSWHKCFVASATEATSTNDKEYAVTNDTGVFLTANSLHHVVE